MLRIGRVATMQGSLRPPSDKSLTHRSYLLSSIASSPSIVSHPLTGEDCQSTLKCLFELGLRVENLPNGDQKLIPPDEWKQPNAPLDCGNAGTLLRLISGLIASRPITATLCGDESLSRRPMKRITEPLRLMGAHIEGDMPPLTIRGSSRLLGIDYSSPVASAQIKSCLLLAGLNARGTTSVSEPHLSRDHTERMLGACGVQLIRDGLKVSLEGGQKPNGFEFSIPADISSAAFFMVAAALLPESNLILHDVGINPTRSGILDVFAQSGLSASVLDERQSLGEPMSDILVRGGKVGSSFSIEGDLVPRLVDEIPILAILATQLDGVSRIRDAKELRVKESDRIEAVANGLRAMGADVEVFEDGMAISGPTRLNGAHIEANHDHRIAMAFAIAGLIAEGETTISGQETIATSYPNFERDLWSVCVV